MSATGDEIVKLNQLKMYVKYASDEDVEAYLTPSLPEEIPVTILKNNLISSDVNATMNSDGLVNISLTLSASSDSVRLYVADELFSIPSKYAPSAIVKGTLGSEEISMNTNGVVTYTGFTSITIRRGLKFPAKISYQINVESDSNATGNEVVRLSQIKKYFGSGGGSGGSGDGWETVWTGSQSSAVAIELPLSTNLRAYKNLAITWNTNSNSGRNEFVIANLPNNPTRYDSDSVLDTGALGWMVYISNNALLGIEAPTAYDDYLTVTKIEVQ